MTLPLIAAGADSADSQSMGDGSWLGGLNDQSMFQQYRGSIPVEQGFYGLARSEDPDYRKPVMRSIVHARVFNLLDPEQLREYTAVMQDIVDQKDGARAITIQIEKPQPGYPNWSAFIQWVTARILPAGQQGAEQYNPMQQPLSAQVSAAQSGLPPLIAT